MAPWKQAKSTKREAKYIANQFYFTSANDCKVHRDQEQFDDEMFDTMQLYVIIFYFNSRLGVSALRGLSPQLNAIIESPWLLNFLPGKRNKRSATCTYTEDSQIFTNK